MTSLALQYLLVGLLLAWSLSRVLGQLFPQLAGKLRTPLAQAASRQGWTRLGRLLQPAQRNQGCDSGCDSCGSCSTTTDAGSQPLSLRGKLEKDNLGRPAR
ncbi:MAG: DUF6587 family protein [Perlucidibaca sp.]